MLFNPLPSEPSEKIFPWRGAIRSQNMKMLIITSYVLYSMKKTWSFHLCYWKDWKMDGFPTKITNNWKYGESGENTYFECLETSLIKPYFFLQYLFCMVSNIKGMLWMILSIKQKDENACIMTFFCYGEIYVKNKKYLDLHYTHKRPKINVSCKGNWDIHCKKNKKRMLPHF